MSVRNSILVLGTAVLVQACAAINNPEGGPKDLESPKLITSFPEDKAVNVNTNTIKLTFNEEVQAPDMTKQLQISPNTDPKYSVKASKNTIELQFDKPLEENTTYQLNFRDGIVDITESNKAQNLVITFSTGPTLDSAQLNGSLKNILTNKPEANMVVALYPESDTANIRKNKPYYYTTSDAAGGFRFSNIKAGNNRIFAHRDKNNDQLYDNESEAIGYLAKPVTAAPADTSVKEELIILTGKADTKKPYILKKEPFTDNFALNYSEGISTFSFQSGKTPKTDIVTTVSPDGKTIRIFPSPTFTVGTYLVTALDSTANSITDTLQISFTGKPYFKNPGDYKLNALGKVAVDQPIELKFDIPFKEVKPDAFTLIEDTIRTRKLTANEFTLSPDKTTLRFTPRITAKNNITLQADSTKLISILGKPVKILPVKLSISDELPIGSVSGIIKTTVKSYQLEFLNAAGEIVRSVKNTRTFSFTDLLPGSYTIRVKIDENNNQRWEGINIDLETEPEPVYFHPNPIEIRANWEIEDLLIEF